MFLNKLEIMKKVIISLQFVLLISILIVSSVILYKMSLEKSISDWENEHFIEEMYIQDNITASILCSNNLIVPRDYSAIGVPVYERGVQAERKSKPNRKEQNTGKVFVSAIQRTGTGMRLRSMSLPLFRRRKKKNN